MKNNRQSFALTLARCLLLCAAATPLAFAQSNTAFTYQGRLTDNSTLASGAYDLQFALFNAVSDGAQQGANVTLSNVSVTNGIFTVSLDFGSAPFAAGAPRFLQIGVRPGGSSSTFTVLTPRQALAPTPYAIHAASATTADTATNATQLGGVDASQFVTGPVVSGVNGLSGNVTLAAGANVTLTPSGNTLTIAAAATGETGNFIQNTTTQQAASNFHISGNGTVGGALSGNVVNAATQYNLNGARILSNAGTQNLFAGVSAGTANTTGIANAFFGHNAGRDNTTGIGNAFFGQAAGVSNTEGLRNSFFGNGAGFSNTTGQFNAFFGQLAGYNNTTANWNAFFGQAAGISNTTGDQNAFFGRNAGFANTTGGQNAFFGHEAGYSNTTGIANTFIGESAGYSNTTGQTNSFVGTDAGSSNTTGHGNTLFGYAAGNDNLTGSYNTFLGVAAGLNNMTGERNVFLGTNAGDSNHTGSRNTLIGEQSDVSGGNLNNATAIGSQAQVGCSNCLVLGSVIGVNFAASSVNVGIGTTNPQARLDIAGGDLALNGNLLLLRGGDDLNHGMFYDPNINGPSFRSFSEFEWRNGIQGATFRMKLAANGNLMIAGAYVQNSDARLKTNVQALPHALATVQGLRGVSFDWKPETRRAPGRQIGFLAQEVEAVLPELVNTDEKGFKSVAYANAVPVLVEAIKEQQQQIEALKSVKAENAELKARHAAIEAQLEQLRQIVCAAHPTASLCQAMR